MVILTAGFKGTLEQYKTYAACTDDCSVAVDKMWRVLIGT
jgi:MFS transporter, PHS family, inorganic phosphate transporter